jgi:hypothetical protein
MNVVLPKPSRYTISDLGSALVVTVPSRKNVFEIGFLLIWLTGWAFGEVAAAGVLLGSVMGLFGLSDGVERSGGMGAVSWGIGAFLLVWLTFWTVGGLMALSRVLWQLFGREVIEVNDEAIILQKRILRFGRPKVYLVEHISRLRALDHVGTGHDRGSVAFDYGAETIRWGAGLNRTQAEEILSAVSHRFGQYDVV